MQHDVAVAVTKLEMNKYTTVLLSVLLTLAPLAAESALTLTYTGNTAKPIAGVKITLTESDVTVTIYASNSKCEVTHPQYHCPSSRKLFPGLLNKSRVYLGFIVL